jgi:hypothetical protein
VTHGREKLYSSDESLRMRCICRFVASDVRPESAKPAKADIDQPSLIRHDEGSSRRRFDFRSIEAINAPKNFNAE